MATTLHFDMEEVREMLQDAEGPNDSILLVSDEGIYLMTYPREDGSVPYARGADPLENSFDSWYGIKQSLDQGHDFNERLGTVSTWERLANLDGDTLAFEVENYRITIKVFKTIAHFETIRDH